MRFWVAVASFVPATALMFMDQTILPVALPAIQKDLGATDSQLQWSVNAYILAIAIFLLVFGKLANSVGFRKIFSIGIIGFVTSSVLCGMSTSPYTLIWMRALQGMSAALMMPPQNAMMRLVFPQKLIGRGIGLVVSTGSIFLMIAPVIGGFLTETFSWRWIFWINVPLGALGLWTAFKLWPESKPTRSPVDLVGFFFFAIGVGLLTFYFMEVVNWGWTSPLSLVCLAIALVSFFLLVLREKNAPHPFLDLVLFKRPLFAAINLSVCTAQAFMMIGVFWLIYFQETLGYTPLQSGFLSFVSGFPLIFASPLAGHLSDRFGPKIPVAFGYLFLLYTCFYLGFFPTSTLPGLVIALFFFGMGIPFILTPSFATAITSVPPTKTAIATGTIITLRMVAGSMGLAFMYLLTSSVYQHKVSEIGELKANIASFSFLHIIIGFLIIISFAITFILHHRKSTHHLPDSPGQGWD